MANQYRAQGGYYSYNYPDYDPYPQPQPQPYYNRGYQNRRGGYRRNYYASPQRNRGYNQNRGYQQQPYQQHPPPYPQHKYTNRGGYYNNRGSGRGRGYVNNNNQQRYRYNNNNKYQAKYNKKNINTSGVADVDDIKKASASDKFDYTDPNWKSKILLPPADNRVLTSDVTQTKGSSFSDFSLSPPLLRGIYCVGFNRPSPVQEESIPNILMGNNVLCRAKNGTGKTGAYCIPVIQLIDINKKYIQSLILIPTRELALQTSRFIRKITKYIINLNVICTTGGTLLRDDIIRFKQSRIKPVHLVVATPGRLLDLAYNGHALLGKCNLIVMDEADKLLSEDFILLINKILSYVPGRNHGRQLLLYSATFPSSIQSFVDKNMPVATATASTTSSTDALSKNKTVYLNLMNDLTLRGITQYYAYVAEHQKVHCLFTLIKKLLINQCIIFCRSMNRVELLARKITKLGFSCFYIHSKMTQLDRNRVFHEFREDKKPTKNKSKSKCRYLICTDLITRGIDVKSVNVVINFDFPKAAETYLHRIGRAGRFGHLAIAINFVTDNDRISLYQIEDDLETEIKPMPKDVQQIDKSLYCQ